jgi:adenosylcobyric acid synthase
MNLRATDLANMGLASRIGAPVLLVADIDRGGVFASVAGTFCLLPADEAKLVRAFAVNRFRGDPSLFANGVAFLEERTARKCLGVFPHAPDIEIDAEDSVCLEDRPAHSGAGPRIAVLRFPRLSNFTDFRLLRGAEWIDAPGEELFDFVILPGTKNTIGDLDWLRSLGLDAWLDRQHRGGATLIGICGGYQMLGRRIHDPHAVESTAPRSAEGLGYLPVSTALAREKTTRVVDAVTPGGNRFEAYEIHMGETERPPGAAPFATIAGIEEGIRSDRCLGTYLHGALENPGVIEEVFNFRPDPGPTKEQMYDRLACWFEQHADLRAFEELYL